MNILKETPRAVLWLLECNRWARDNLQRAVQAHGVDAKRLIFAPRLPMEQHLARHYCADLFLDTLPYNAHTTASDALWIGLPLLTCSGDTFASTGCWQSAAGCRAAGTGHDNAWLNTRAWRCAWLCIPRIWQRCTANSATTFPACRCLIPHALRGIWNRPTAQCGFACGKRRRRKHSPYRHYLHASTRLIQAHL